MKKLSVLFLGLALFAPAVLSGCSGEDAASKPITTTTPAAPAKDADKADAPK
jgi:hypothetical protein